jgi:hypothetical protein
MAICSNFCPFNQVRNADFSFKISSFLAQPVVFDFHLQIMEVIVIKMGNSPIPTDLIKELK